MRRQMPALLLSHTTALYFRQRINQYLLAGAAQSEPTGFRIASVFLTRACLVRPRAFVCLGASVRRRAVCVRACVYL